MMFSDTYKIAIIDDDPEQLKVVHRKLKYIFPKDAKIEFLLFRGSVEFEQKLLRADFYIIDYDMPPGINGTQLINRYSLQSDCALFSGSDKDTIRRGLGKYSCVPVYTKPYDLDLLKDRLLQHHEACMRSRA